VSIISSILSACNCFSEILSFYRISQTDNASYAGTKANTTLVLPWKLIVQQSFQPPAYFVIFSDEFKFTYKTVCSQTKHAVAPFPMMLFGFCFVWFKSFGSACRATMARMFRENFSSGSTG
jgi:hypothetical protein